MHSVGLELTKQTYFRLEDNLIRHRGDNLGGRLTLEIQAHTAVFLFILQAEVWRQHGPTLRNDSSFSSA